MRGARVAKTGREVLHVHSWRSCLATHTTLSSRLVVCLLPLLQLMLLLHLDMPETLTHSLEARYAVNELHRHQLVLHA